MRDSKLRRQIAREAARLMFAQETEAIFRARLQAQRRLQAWDARPFDLPTDENIADELANLAAEHPDYYAQRDRAAADVGLLKIVRLLAKFRPRVERQLGLVRIHLCQCSAAELSNLLTAEGLEFVPPSPSDPANWLLTTPLPLQLQVHAFPSWEEVPSEVPTDWESISDLEQRLATNHPVLDLSTTVGLPTQQIDRFLVYRQLLLPLEEVQLNPVRHPEGDALYHSLQVFSLVKDERPYDEELLLAGLLHEVGRALDPHDPVAAAVAELVPFTTERTRWLIEFRPVALQILDSSIGHRAHRRLQAHADYEELLLLARCDRAGCVCGAIVPELDEALAYVQQLAEENG
jgi:hypothetical protein